jgi:hypothetical protein
MAERTGCPILLSLWSYVEAYTVDNSTIPMGMVGERTGDTAVWTYYVGRPKSWKDFTCMRNDYLLLIV